MSNSIELDPVCMVKKLMFNVHLMFTTSKSKKRFDCLSTNNLTKNPGEQFPIGTIDITKISFVICCSPETIGNPKHRDERESRR